ncbi:acetate/propionate family kinase [Acuticoccus sp. MNP-M23]|uniref:acetate/propionate family kinase n=1 Tax=Acuticoccus sp. MNP-M23 TaxID=3072793 RepID=UPI002815E310|nr:acetate/propionate family kinase [Acuticoccus sp. MNP-M23]WMS44645.1 acetate/propionate family kinase [Acuticoccus sp. MNP-M23]
MSDTVLVLNVGSSSIKFALYGDPAARPLLRGKIAGIGIGAGPVLSARDEAGNVVPADEIPAQDPAAGHDALIPSLLTWLAGYQRGTRIVAAGHRVVHGGRDLAGPQMVSDALLAELDALVPLAPLHQPHNLAAIRAVSAFMPGLPQVACFDTSFHRTQDRLAQLFALPRALTDAGIIRYGFHGLSYEYVASALPVHLGGRAEGRVLVAHLGNGASVCAMRARQSVATSMGFTALDGLMMGRRCGAIDPGVLLHLMEGHGMTAAEVAHLLYEESGLFGVSGLTNDVRVLEASTAPEAQEALALFAYRAACEMASLAAAMEGLDAIVFTAGIGENSALVRDAICARLGWLGVALNKDANAANAARISAASSRVDVLVLPTDEEGVIARATRALTSG